METPGEYRDDMKRLASFIISEELDSEPKPSRAEVSKFLREHFDVARREALRTHRKTHKVLIAMAKNHYNRRQQ